METIKKIEFVAEIVKEYSSIPTLEPQGTAKCSMELFINDGTVVEGCGVIEWIIEYTDSDGELNGDEAIETIGVWIERKTLTDYDGIFNLPKEAVSLLRQSGIRVPRHFEN